MLLCHLKSTCWLLKGKEAAIDSIWIYWWAHVTLSALRAGVIKCDGEYTRGQRPLALSLFGVLLMSLRSVKFELDLLQHITSWELCKLIVRNLILATTSAISSTATGARILYPLHWSINCHAAKIEQAPLVIWWPSTGGMQPYERILLIKSTSVLVLKDWTFFIKGN